ncbi:unnamed protein product [Auanema sp. JU1783]|nr:unnamed protein product [Auanema sp. JU1783]
MSQSGIQQPIFMPFEGNLPESASTSPPAADPTDLLRMIAEASAQNGYGGVDDLPKATLERLLNSASGDLEVAASIASSTSTTTSPEQFANLHVSAFGLPTDFAQFTDFGTVAMRNSSKTLKCPKCNWHYKYQETLEIHMKEKHSDSDLQVKCVYCAENRSHPKLARGETYSCGYKPYRCELCKYSTTTKGNLSIHMQSDKHLHAVQDLPTNIANLSCTPSSVSSAPVVDSDKLFICIVCGCYSTDDINEVIGHVEKDRSRSSMIDVSVSNGLFRCHLCPYSTNLKANFQLHTRTDKHLQRVQMINHIREGSPANSAHCRLASTKSIFQVLCRPCQEVLSSGQALRDHCDTILHRTNSRQPLTLFRCQLCSFETQSKSEAIGHMTCHEPATWPKESVLDFNALDMEEDAAYACASCGFTAKEASTLEEHAKTHEEGELCPLCNERTSILTDHLIQEHKIAESAVDKLLQVHQTDSANSPSAFTYRCSNCNMAFKSEASLQSHAIIHLFQLSYKCPVCPTVCDNAQELKNHTDTKHGRSDESDEISCDLCQETFPNQTALVAHFNSVSHLHKAKKQLEQGSVDLSAQVLASLNAPSSPGSERKPYKCNVCRISYGQGATLDIHLRSVAHQSRMGKLSELVASGEVDCLKPVLEQPGLPIQKLIKDVISKDDIEAASLVGVATASGSGSGGASSSAASQQHNVMTMLNLMNMLMGQNPSNLTMPFSGMSGDESSTNDSEEDLLQPITSTQLLQMMKKYGLDKLTSITSELLLKFHLIVSIPDEKIASLAQVDCSSCGETLPSLLALSQHFSEQHANSSIPESTNRSFVDRLLLILSDVESRPSGNDSSVSTSRAASRDASEPPEKRARNSPTPPIEGSGSSKSNDLAQMAMLSMMGGLPYLGSTSSTNPLSGFMPQAMQDFFNNQLLSQQMGQSPAKRARTRISDDQLKILRQYFDINNSPTEAQIKEMSIKAGLPEKVIKHWFRNTLFKERQRDKDSPYNFSVPPQMAIDLDAYEKTGEAKILPLSNLQKIGLKSDSSDDEGKKPPSSSVVAGVSQLSGSGSSSGPSSAASGVNSTSGSQMPESATAAAAAAAAALAAQAAAVAPSGAGASTSSGVPLNLQAMMQQMQQAAAAAAAAGTNPFQFMEQQMHGQMSSSAPTGRRANRTRFTDYQLRTLQQFFDKQAYPKDDDLEVLSKKLQLSPRVIVVWFQNARQKARKIYENHPNHENSDRFVRTPGCNFQCKRCNLVFQRYYELIQHQQKACYKDDGIALANDNKGVEETLTDDEKAQLVQQTTISALAEATKPSDIMKLLGGSKSSTEALLKMCESANQSSFASSSTPTTSSSPPPASSNFNKRCPYCALLFRNKNSMIEHIGNRHAQQVLFQPVDVDELPEAEDVPLLSGSNNSSDANADFASSAAQDRESLSMSPFLNQSDGDETNDYIDDASFTTFLSSAAGSHPASSRSPANCKRYRTHLTPLQVHVMKCIFTDYKTPSMTECDTLGREIGLHKRVVQVWFQNARAKERKSRASNGDDDVFRNTAKSCELCNVEYTGRTTMQDHLFSSTHLAVIKASSKNELGPEISNENGGHSGSSEKSMKNSSSLSKVPKTSQISNLPLNGFPLSLMISGSTLPLVFDQAIFGVPVSLLQIPENVKDQIKTDMGAGLTSTTFTHDGETVDGLRESISSEDSKWLVSEDVEVGWGCPACSNVFQMESQLKSHQRQFCPGSTVFTLIQTHYSCSLCDQKYGSQREYQTHITSLEHQTKRITSMPELSLFS